MMTHAPNPTLQKLKARLTDLDCLGSALGVLGWDLETYMPPKGGESRADVSATLCRMAHEAFVAPEVGEWLQTLLTQLPALPTDKDRAMVQQAWRSYQREVKVPTTLVEALDRASSKALPVWANARKTNQFDAFKPLLTEIVQLNQQKAQALGYTHHPYDALLDGFEPDMTTTLLDPLFAQLQAHLTPLVNNLTQSVTPSLPAGPYPKQAQMDFSHKVLTAMGFDLERGRLDESVHPFTCGLHPDDVRLTTRLDEADPLSCLFSVLHEGGHGLYEQGQQPDLWGRGLFGGASLGIHESQSRLWENLVGRSMAFWQVFYPAFQAAFAPVLDAMPLAVFYQAVNRVSRSPIRVEADEVTYNLHILLRYQLEKDLMTGTLTVDQLPDAWNAGMETLLGYTPKNHAEGCLQDVHWAHGTIGYFPTYTLGNVYASMFWAKAEQAGVTQPIAQGDMKPLLGWLQTHIHGNGLMESPNQLVQRVTGQPLTAQYFTQYLDQKYCLKGAVV
jgi:carboxypeptidase Taq